MTSFTKGILALALILAGAMAAETALAGRSSVTFGFSFGFPGYWYYPPPYYYPPAYPYYNPYYYPPYADPSAPVTYTEQGAQPGASQPPTQWWYYCVDSKAYYPYVRECAGGWQRVPPTPAG